MSTLLQSSFAKGEVSDELFGRVDTAMYKIGLKTARNVMVRTQGGIINRAGLRFVGYATSNSSKSKLRRFRFNTTDTYILEFSALKMRVIRNDALVTETAQAIINLSSPSPATLGIVAHGWSAGDDIIITGGMPRLNQRTLRVGSVPDVNHITLQDIITGQAIDASTFGSLAGGGTAARIYTLATPYQEADLHKLKFVQSASVLTITHNLYDERRLTRISNANWTLTVPTFAPVTAAPTGVSLAVGSAGTVTASYVVTATDATTGEESLPSAIVTFALTATPSDNTISWSAGTNIADYSVYKAVNGVYGFVGDTPNLSFREVNLAPTLSTTPPLARNPFTGAGNQPAASSYYQQRHVRGGTLNAPDTNYFSQAANFYNMSVSQPSADGDAITEVLTSREVNEIRHYVPIKADLLVFTAGNEWRIQYTGGGFSATTSAQSPQSAWGCSHLEPIVVGLTVLFVPETQINVRTARYTYMSDSYTGEDLTVLSNHLFRNLTMTAWAFGRTPDPIVFGVRSDGTATTLTYQEEQQITAWTRWDTSGAFEDVDVIRPNDATVDDVPYFVTTRTINGNRVRFIERLAGRRYTDVRDCFFVDCGVSYDKPVAITGVAQLNPVLVTAPAHGFVDGDLVDVYDIVWVPNIDDVDTETQPAQLNTNRYTVTASTTNTLSLVGADGRAFNGYVSGGTLRKPTMAVTGADHLEGRAVAILADGNVVEGLTVVNGGVTLPFLASRIHLGLKYISDVEPLTLEAPQGTIQGKIKRVSAITLRLSKSRGVFAGSSADTLMELKQREFEDYGEPIDLFSGDKKMMVGSTWGPDGNGFIRQRYPLPMDILALIPELEIED